MAMTDELVEIGDMIIKGDRPITVWASGHWMMWVSRSVCGSVGVTFRGGRGEKGRNWRGGRAEDLWLVFSSHVANYAFFGSESMFTVVTGETDCRGGWS